MENGKIKQSGPAREIYAAPKDRYVAEFLGGQNVLSGKVGKINGTRAMIASPAIAGIQIPMHAGARLEAGQAIDIAVRRDDVELFRKDTALSEDMASVPATILGIEYQGNFVKVMLDAAGEEGFVAYMPERRFFENPFEVGDSVLAAWLIDRAHLLA